MILQDQTILRSRVAIYVVIDRHGVRHSEAVPEVITEEANCTAHAPWSKRDNDTSAAYGSRRREV